MNTPHYFWVVEMAKIDKIRGKSNPYSLFSVYLDHIRSSIAQGYLTFAATGLLRLHMVLFRPQVASKRLLRP